jgi:multiple sugar transport system permease protein
MKVALLRPSPGRPQGRRSAEQAERRLARRLVSPSLALVALVAAYPIGYALWLSLHEYSVRIPGLSRWAGFRNYSTALGDGEFTAAIANTLLFTVCAVSIELVLGMVMALMMHQAFRGRGLLRAVVLVPWAVLTVVSAITWQTIFQPQLGFVNSMFTTLHLPGADTVWLGQNGTAMAALVLADVWKTAPFMALLLLAGLQVIPNELHDAARVDGASAWQRFWRITLPLLRPAILVALIFRTLDALRVFDLPYLLTRGTHGTNMMSVEAYTELRTNRLIGLGSAESVITFVVVMLVSLAYIRAVGGNLRGLMDERA